MLRIIIGIIIVIAFLGSLASQSVPNFGSDAEMMGYVISQIAFVALAIWLIYSGIEKRQRKKGNQIEKVKGDVLPLVREYFHSFKAFLTKYVMQSKTPYWFLVLWGYGLSKALIRLDISVGGAGIDYSINNWTVLWMVGLILGLIMGLIGYWLLGSLFHLGVLIAGGKGMAKTSRLINLYASLPHTLVVIAVIAFNMLALRGSYFEYGGLANVWIFMTFAAAIYSWYLGYVGAMEIQKTKRVRSILIFLVLPILLQSSIFLYSYLA